LVVVWRGEGGNQITECPGNGAQARNGGARDDHESKNPAKSVENMFRKRGIGKERGRKIQPSESCETPEACETELCNPQEAKVTEKSPGRLRLLVLPHNQNEQ